MSAKKGSNKPVKLPENAAPKEMSTKGAYFASLSEWARHSTHVQMCCNFLNCRAVCQGKQQLMQPDQAAGAEAAAEANDTEARDLQSDIELMVI